MNGLSRKDLYPEYINVPDPAGYTPAEAFSGYSGDAASLYLIRRTPSSKLVDVILNGPISLVELTCGPMQGQAS